MNIYKRLRLLSYVIFECELLYPGKVQRSKTVGISSDFST